MPDSPCYPIYERKAYRLPMVAATKGKQPSIFFPPREARRVIVFANVKSFDVSSVGLLPGDWCIHINHAVHAQRAMKQRGTWHSLFVRHGKNMGTGYLWHSPGSHEGFYQVIYFNGGLMPGRAWLREYRLNSTPANPTSGFICYQEAKAACPNLPVILAGFSPETDVSYRWPGHGWQYESEYYRKNNVPIIRP